MWVSSFRQSKAEHHSMKNSSTNFRQKMLAVYVRGLASGKYKLRQAAESTGYSMTWLSLLKKRYLVEGDSVFENKNRGRVAVNRISESVRQHIAALYASEYKDINFSYFQDCLEESENIKISYPTLCSILKEYGIKSPEAHKIKRREKIHRPRVRRECEGDLIQIDGTPFAWFYKSGDLNKYCMVGAIDDATGKITGLYITKNECLYGYLEILRQMALSYGLPREIYSDRAAIFCVTPRDKNLAAWEKLEALHEKRTQWQRILSELNINQILAWSPQAKGRVERMWRTLQGQLPQWFYSRGIKTVEAANAALSEYIAWFNKKYSIPPAIDDAFYLAPPADLDDILCAQFSRRLDRQGCLVFQSTQFYIPGSDLACVDGLICVSEKGLFFKYKGTYYRLQPLDGHIKSVYGDTLPVVVSDIVYRYLFAFAKEISA